MRTFLVLVENKTINRNRAEKNAAEMNLRKEREREDKNQQGSGCWQHFINFGKDQITILGLKLKYIGIPLMKAMPSVIFRLMSFWLLLTYCSEFYPGNKETSPGLGLIVPSILILIVIGINFGVGHMLGLKMEEVTTNCITNLVIPVYVDLFSLVSVLLLLF